MRCSLQAVTQGKNIMPLVIGLFEMMKGNREKVETAFIARSVCSANFI
jgi:hypothetical protein